MDPAVTEKAVSEQLRKVDQLEVLRKSHDWKIKRPEPDRILLTVRPASQPNLSFTVRYDCSEYPQRAPSLQFVDPETGELGQEYWPDQGKPFKAAVNRDKNRPELCIQGIREFHEGCHANDDERPWDPDKFPFVTVWQELQMLLDEAYR